MWRFNELLKRTQMLVNSLRDGEPSCLALEPEVSDLILYPDRDRDIGKHQKVEELIMWCVCRGSSVTKVRQKS